MVLRRHVTVLVAPGGVGKTALTIGMMLCLLTGRPLLGAHVHAACNVLACNLEDGPDEFARRMLAGMMQHSLTPDDMVGQLHTIDGRSDRLVMASLDIDNTTVVHPHEAAMTEFLMQHSIGLAVVDPFVNSHELDENSNPHVNAAARSWARAAEAAGCAVLLVHHTRKGAAAGDMEASRGATALVFASRIGLVLSAMQPEDAARFGIEVTERARHLRLDDGKRNLAPASEASWVRLESIALGNGTEEYPNGDNVQACVPWRPPAAAGNATMPEVVAVLELIAEGPGDGELYAPFLRSSDASRWVGTVVMERLRFDKPRATRLVKAGSTPGCCCLPNTAARHSAKTAPAPACIRPSWQK